MGTIFEAVPMSCSLSVPFFPFFFFLEAFQASSCSLMHWPRLIKRLRHVTVLDPPLLLYSFVLAPASETAAQKSSLYFSSQLEAMLALLDSLKVTFSLLVSFPSIRVLKIPTTFGNVWRSFIPCCLTSTLALITKATRDLVVGLVMNDEGVCATADAGLLPTSNTKGGLW